jgi:hypothetical protein
LSQSDRPLNSKELKIILKSDKFTDVATYKENIINLIKSQIQKQGGTFDDTSQEEDHRKVWYLDTKNFKLNNNNFLLRIREKLKNNEEEKVKGYDVVLKNRDDDRHNALKYDLSKPKKNPDFNYKGEPEFKFEEDILTPFHSKYSASTKLKFEPEQKPKLETWQDILNIFSNLDLGISSTESLLRVNGFMAKELSYELGNIVFKDGNKAKTEFSLWYEPTEEDKDWSFENKKPVIVEFDVSIEAKESSSSGNGTLSGEFPSSFLEETKTFYMELQKEDIVDLCAKKTKTEFVYEYKEQ